MCLVADANRNEINDLDQNSDVEIRPGVNFIKLYDANFGIFIVEIRQNGIKWHQNGIKMAFFVL